MSPRMLRRMRSTVLRRLPLTGGLGLLAAAAVLVLLPMHGNGLSGSAVQPQYGAYYWASYQPLPAHPTTAELRRAGLQLPQDLVSSRRYMAAAVGATGVAATALGLLVRRRPDGTGKPKGELWAG